MDLAGIGYTYLFAGVAIWTGIAFFLLEICLKIFDLQTNRWLKLIQVCLIIWGLCVLGLTAWFCTETGQILLKASKELDNQNQQIFINASCIGYNCTADIPNNLQISCPIKDCPQQNICPTQKPIPTPTPQIIVYKCPCSLSIPKFYSEKDLER